MKGRASGLERKDLASLASVKPPGYPFYAEAADTWETGATRYLRRHEFVLFGRRVLQNWTLRVRPPEEPPGRLEQRLYETLEGLREEFGLGRSLAFDLEGFTDHFLGSTGKDAQEAILAAIRRAFSAHMERRVYFDGVEQWYESCGLIGSYGIERDDEGRTRVEVNFSAL